MPAPLTLTEGAPSQLVALTKAEYRALNTLGIAVVTPTLEDDIFEVSAGAKVGALSVGDRQVIVQPKITDITRLIFMLGYARNPQIWRDDPNFVTPHLELLPALAETFARIATRAVEPGLLHGYRTVEDALPVLRGRMLAGEQMTRRFGFPLPVSVEYDDFTIDIAENQLLAMATQRLLKVPRITDAARRQLNRLRHTLVDVPVPPEVGKVPQWRVNRLNIRYQPALHLADLALAAGSFEHRVGNLRVTGYMFDMWEIFEDFVTVALSESLSRSGHQCQLQASLDLDEQGRIRMKPDLVCRRSGVPTAVVDAKYKAERSSGFPNADLYQMLAYCTVLGLDAGHLVYAKGNEEVRVHTVVGAGVTVHCHALDLSLEPESLLDQVNELAAAVIAPSNIQPPALGGGLHIAFSDPARATTLRVDIVQREDALDNNVFLGDSLGAE